MTAKIVFFPGPTRRPVEHPPSRPKPASPVQLWLPFDDIEAETPGRRRRKIIRMPLRIRPAISGC